MIRSPDRLPGCRSPRLAALALASLSGLLLGAALLFAAPTPAAAQYVPRTRSAVPEPAPNPIASANDGVVTVISGGVDGTYVRIAADLAAVLDSDRLRVLPVIGKGSLQNVADILYLRGIDVGIVQSDVLAYMKRQNVYPGVQQQLGFITRLYAEEVHVLARGDVAQLSDLAHQKVNVDVVGSGTAMTASVLFGSLGIAPETTNADQETALEQLRRGQIAAIVYVVGKPARLFSGIPAGSGLHFLPIPVDEQLLDTYLPTKLGHDDYPALVDDGAPVETVAVGSVMAVYNWAPGMVRYRHVARFVDEFFSRFREFQQPPRHPKWRDVNLAAQVPGWTRFAAAQDWLARQSAAGAPGRAPPAAEFTTFLNSTGRDTTGLRPDTLTDAQKAALFQQFLRWQSTRGATR